MKRNPRPHFVVLLLFVLAVSQGNAAPADAPAGGPGATTALKWKDGKKAVFLLMFDDSAPSAVKTVIPELKKRGMTGTFYLSPGGGLSKLSQRLGKRDWGGRGLVLPTHTLPPRGATSPASSTMNF